MKQIKAIVFDLDDTLYDCKQYWYKIFEEISEYTSSNYSKNKVKVYNFIKKIFEEKTSSYQYLFNDLIKEFNLPKNSLKEFIKIYRNFNGTLNLYEDFAEQFSDLKKEYKLGIITNGHKQNQTNKIRMLKLEKEFDHIMIVQGKNRKPNFKTFNKMANKLGIKTNEMVFVGDNPEDDFPENVDFLKVRLIRGQFQSKKGHEDVQIKHYNELKEVIENRILKEKNWRNKMKILVIAPHPDDEVLGCGGTIKRYTNENHEVSLCIMTKAYTPDWTKEFIKKRPIQIKKSCEILGIKKAYFMGLPTVKTDTIPQKRINKKLSEIIKKVNPDVIFLPHGGDLNIDHRICFESGLVATRPHLTNIKKILTYETLSETEWGQSLKQFKPTTFINIKSTIKDKIKAMEQYNSEVKKFPHPRSIKVIESLAIKRGSESGFEYAEAFEIIREIE